jgi:hypothetical protein
MVDGQQPRLARLQILVFDDQRVEFEVAVVRVIVAPIPLLTGGLDGEIGLRRVEL